MSKSSHIRVVLVCSGSNEWDDGSRLSGAADLPLSEPGFAGAEALVVSMACGAAVEVWTSPEEAASATAHLIGRQCGLKPRVRDDLHEVGLGLWEGMCISDAEERFGSVFKAWREDPFSVVPPEGEPLAAAQARVQNALRDIALRTKADDSSGVCVVLRPMAFEIGRAWFAGETALADGCPPETAARVVAFVVDRAELKRASKAVGDPMRDAG